MEGGMDSEKKRFSRWLLLILNCAAMGIGVTAGPLLLRFYFLHGGSRLWLASWLQTAGCPILILPLCISYRKHHNTHTRTRVTPTLCLVCIAIGVLTGLDNYMYTYGVSYLPLSTSSLLSATQLAFNAIFAYILVGHKFTPYSINAVILLTMGPILLAFHSSKDMPQGLATTRYWLGFVIIIGAAAGGGLISPLIELVIKKTGRRIITYRLLIEMQLIMSFSATVFCTVGMLVNKDFQALAREAKRSDVGEFKYYMILVWSAICCQLTYIGMFGVIFLSSSLLSGVLAAIFIPVTQVLAVIFYHEKFSGEKGMSLAIALWGFASYLYGEYMGSKLEVSNMNKSVHEGESASVREEEERALELAVPV